MEIDRIYREIAPKLQTYLTGNGCTYAQACDIVQETFLRVWKRREELTDDLHQISGFVFTIARNYRNDLVRKSHHEVYGEEDEEGEAQLVSDNDAASPCEEKEETVALRRRLKAALSRMPVQLLEAFALSRLGTLSVKEIAEGTGLSEANVKVRVHRARELLMDLFKNETTATVSAEEGGDEAALLKAMMMFAAVDGEIAKEELAVYRSLAEELRVRYEISFESLWENSVRAMAYIGFLTEMLEPEEIVKEFVREAGHVPRFCLAALEKLGAADGDYSHIERACISALSSNMKA